MTTFWPHRSLDLPRNPTLRRMQTLRRRDPGFSVERSTVYSLDEIVAIIDRVAWRQSKGYDRPDGQHVARHQYIVRQRYPDEFAALCWWLEHAPDTYQGVYGGYTYTYWNHDGWRYWYAGYGVILNRAELEDVARDPMVEVSP